MTVLHIDVSETTFTDVRDKHTLCGKWVWASDACTASALRANVRPAPDEVLCGECKAASVERALKKDNTWTVAAPGEPPDPKSVFSAEGWKPSKGPHTWVTIKVPR